MTTAASVYPALEARPLKDTICLFDVDETLTKARRVRCNGVSFD
jgi:phosphomannomutase